MMRRRMRRGSEEKVRVVDCDALMINDIDLVGFY